MNSGYIVLTSATVKDQTSWVSVDDISVIQTVQSAIKARQVTTVLLRNGHSLSVTESDKEILLAIIELAEPKLPGEKPVTETPAQEGTEAEKPKRAARS